MVIRKYFSSKYSDQKHDNDAVKKKKKHDNDSSFLLITIKT